MPFADDMIPRLRSLAPKLIELEMYESLSEVAELLMALASGNWPKLSYNDQESYLEKMKVTFHPRVMGDSVLWKDPDYNFIADRVEAELRAIRKK